MTQKNSAEWSALAACCKPTRDLVELSKLLGQVDWPALLTLAEEHGVTQLLAAAVQEMPDGARAGESSSEETATAPGLKPGRYKVNYKTIDGGSSRFLAPADVQGELAELQRAQTFFTLRMSAELFRLTQLFAAQQIGMLVVKGPALAMQAYGDAEMRNYGDLDFLVRHGDIARATQLMMDAGYAPQIPLSAIAEGKIPGQYMFRQTETKVLVELHNDRTMRYYPRGLPIEEIFSRSVQVKMDGREIPAPCVEDHLILICIHGAKHFWERLMWIADVAALVARQTELRWEQAARAARDAGAETMLHGGLLLAAGVLQAPVPPAVLERAKADTAAQRLTEQVLRWLPEAGEARPEFERGLWQRAIFRMRMRGGAGAGLSYFLRLLFSPTEEDWDVGAGGGRVADVLKRPFRLAKKHGAGESRDTQ